MKRLFVFLVVTLAAPVLSAATTTRTVSFIVDPAPGRPVQHGLEQLGAALRAFDWTTQVAGDADRVTDAFMILAGTSPANGPAVRVLRDANLAPPFAPESLVVHKLTVRGTPALVVCGADDRGLMYALLEIADQIRASTDARRNPLAGVREIAESPATRDRSLSVYPMHRAQWENRFYDEPYWTRYFDLLAASRFNRFRILFDSGLAGFPFPPYPYFFDTPGFPGVQRNAVTSRQQRKNLDALNRLIELAHDRGIAVTLGLGDLSTSVDGITAGNLPAYTLASLKELLVRVPGVDALHFRLHGQPDGKREARDDVWPAVFQLVQTQRPGLRLEIYARGMLENALAAAGAQGVNLQFETDLWSEPMGLPYPPLSVNVSPRDGGHDDADLFRHPQRYPLGWRLGGGGTSRVLLWGDPEYVRRLSASAQRFDRPNWDVPEPFAARMEGQPPEAAPTALMPAPYRHYEYEFERYWHFFQTWGRVGYNPATSPIVWQREFQRRFGPAAGPHVEAGLHRASQVLPMIVAAVYPLRLAASTRAGTEWQSLGPNLADYAKNEGLDTAQFENFVDAARRIVAGGTTTKRTPDATSRWFDETADAILASVGAAESAIGRHRNKEYDATITDLRILAQLARFHARRTIAAVHYNLFTRGLKLGELLAATLREKEAVAAWRELVAIAGDRYAFDLATDAQEPHLGGHWRDELKKLESNLRELEDQCCPPDEAILKEPVWTPARAQLPELLRTDPPFAARPGEPLRVSARVADPSVVQSIRLRYRHLNEFEAYQTLEMNPTGTPGEFSAVIPGAFIVPAWDLIYFFEIRDQHGHGANRPDLLQGMPYVMVKVARD